MPTYRYECPNGHTLEDFEPMSAPTMRPCPECPDQTDGCEGCGIESTIVYMRRVIGPGGGVIWKQGPPTRRFHK